MAPMTGTQQSKRGTPGALFHPNSLEANPANRERIVAGRRESKADADAMNAWAATGFGPAQQYERPGKDAL